MTFDLKCCTIKAYFNVKCDFVCSMKICKYERIFLLEKYAHNTTKYIVKYTYSPMMMSSSYHVLLKYESMVL